MDIIERHPCPVVGSEVALLECRPQTVAARHTAHVALNPLGVVLRIGIGTGFQFADEILHTLLALSVARGGIDSHRRQIMAAHVSVESVPVRIRLSFRRQSRFFEIRCQQSVAVILQQRLDVQVAGLLQRTVEQLHITKWELVGIESVLRRRRADRK